MIDLVYLRKEFKRGTFNSFIKNGMIYIQDTENGECIMIGYVKEAEERGRRR